MKNLSGPAYVLMLFLMFIGAAPCSTGGGFKVTSFFILICSLVAFLRGTTPHAFSRKITTAQMQKTFALFTLEVVYLLIAIVSISTIEKYFGQGIEQGEITFEVVSAFATVGLSQGATPLFTIGSKVIFILTMFIGRLGPLTIVSIWNDRKYMLEEKDIKYVDGKILIG